jgi:hypothetical protein
LDFYQGHRVRCLMLFAVASSLNLSLRFPQGVFVVNFDERSIRRNFDIIYGQNRNPRSNATECDFERRSVVIGRSFCRQAKRDNDVRLDGERCRSG